MMTLKHRLTKQMMKIHKLKNEIVNQMNSLDKNFKKIEFKFKKLVSN